MLSKILIGNCGECPPRSGGWRVSRRQGRIFFYLAAYMIGLVCHIGDSSVTGSKLRSSRRLEFLAVPLSSLSYVPIYYFSVLSEYFGAATLVGGYVMRCQKKCTKTKAGPRGSTKTEADLDIGQLYWYSILTYLAVNKT